MSLALPELDEQLEFEALFSDLLAGFLSAPDDQLDAEIVRAIRRVVEFLGLDQGILVQWGKDPSRFHPSHSWTIPGGLPVSAASPQPPAVLWVHERSTAGKIVLFSSVDELPAEAEQDKAFFRSAGTQSLISLPLSPGSRVVGALIFLSQSEETRWPNEVVRRLRLIADVFAHALARRRASQVLRESKEELHRTLEELKRLQDRLQQENLCLRQEAQARHGPNSIVGSSDALMKVLRQAEQVATTDSTVLIQGETGTGKELLAQYMHSISRRSVKAFVTTNIAAIPATLLESELFGREKGAYTGALTKEIGRFELADSGTLFLDEVGEMPIETQVKLLRVLQTGGFERLGSSRPLRVNVRVIAATNSNLPELIKAGMFRQDLFYRLNVFPITLPPLRNRLEDIPLLVWAFVKELSEKMGKAFERIRKKDLEALRSYDWPGNVRELRNVVERSMILTEGPELRLILPDGQAGGEGGFSRRLMDIQRQHVLNVLESARNRIRGAGGAAEILGVKPSTLYSLMARLGIPRTR